MIEGPQLFELTPSDRQSAAWVKLLRFFNEQLEVTRAKNDGDHDATTTAALRGQIAVYKRLIDLDKDLPAVEL